MIRVQLFATDDELLELIRPWLDALANEDYEQVFAAIGYAMAHGDGAHAIRRDIRSYRSAEYYPGVSDFRVSDWRTAKGGNPNPLLLVRRYVYSPELPIVATVEMHLPLNGRWSDLEADFVVTKPSPQDEDAVLWLEDISSPSRYVEETDA